MIKLLRKLVSNNQRDTELRERIRLSPLNGSYATIICRRCENFRTDPGGQTNTAEIVKRCSKCSSPVKL